jgi:hypothetical protein
MSTSDTTPVRPGYQVGLMRGFSLFFEIKPGKADDLRRALED